MSPIREESKTGRILIVDDNPANVQLLEMMLYIAGYTNVRSTTDPTEVKGLHQKWSFDVILLDIKMPELDGFGVMEQLAEIDAEDYLPVLVITAQQEQETRLKALEWGAKDFVTKPFDKSEVLHRIANMMEVRALYNERKRQAEILEAKVRERTRELNDRNMELEETRLEIIRRLGRAGEYRDNETGMHVIRMSKCCQRLALAAGLDEEHAKHILNANPMHDVGKIGIPDRILLKPGRFDPDEWEIMKTHTTIGADIIGDHRSPIMKMARTIARTHHEKWDGSGYPNALKGEEIPFDGRISAVCDVFDALTSERPYKTAWPVDEAVAYINENSGSHFDPALVPLFNGALDDILRIGREHPDEEEHSVAGSYSAAFPRRAARLARVAATSGVSVAASMTTPNKSAT